MTQRYAGSADSPPSASAVSSVNPKSKRSQRWDRQAAALRANLRRRKQAARHSTTALGDAEKPETADSKPPTENE